MDARNWKETDVKAHKLGKVYELKILLTMEM